MSARKLGSTSSFDQRVTVEARQARLTLSPESVSIHKGGIEFRSETPFARWVEMTVTLESQDGGRVHCTGVVVDCVGSKHSGYQVSMIFTGLSKQAEARLNNMAQPSANW